MGARFGDCISEEFFFRRKNVWVSTVLRQRHWRFLCLLSISISISFIINWSHSIDLEFGVIHTDNGIKSTFYEIEIVLIMVFAHKPTTANTIHMHRARSIPHWWSMIFFLHRIHRTMHAKRGDDIDSSPAAISLFPNYFNCANENNLYAQNFRHAWERINTWKFMCINLSGHYVRCVTDYVEECVWRTVVRQN